MRNLRDEARWIIGEIDEAKRLAKAVGKPQLGTSSIEAGRVEEYNQDGALVQIIGEQYDGTHAPVTVNGPTPHEPAGLSLTVGVGSVEARWNGKFSGDAVSPMDFSHVSLHGSRPEVFTPSNETQLATIAGELGDVATVILEPGEWTFGLVAVSKAGKWSELSETVTVEIPDYPDFAELTDDLVQLDQDIAAAKEQLAPLPGLIEDNQAKVDAARDRLDALEGTTLPGLSEEVDAAQGRLSEAEAQLGQNVDAITQAKSDLDAAFGRLDSLQVDVESIATASGKAVTYGSVPPSGVAPGKALWVTPSGHTYVSKEC